MNFRLEEAEARFRNRQSREEDVEMIQSLKLALSERELELKKMLVSSFCYTGWHVRALSFNILFLCGGFSQSAERVDKN